MCRRTLLESWEAIQGLPFPFLLDMEPPWAGSPAVENSFLFRQQLD